MKKEKGLMVLDRATKQIHFPHTHMSRVVFVAAFLTLAVLSPAAAMQPLPGYKTTMEVKQKPQRAPVI
jgi:hypothetical protein